MELDTQTFEEINSKLEAILNSLGASKNQGVNFNSDNTFVEKAKRNIRETTSKYSSVGNVNEQQMNRLFRYFEKAINDTQAFLKLVNGRMVIERVEAGRVTLQERKESYNFDSGKYEIDVRL